MSTIKTTTLEETSSKISKWIDNAEAKTISKSKMRVWSKRLELLFGFIPALLVWLATYGKKFR